MSLWQAGDKSDRKDDAALDFGAVNVGASASQDLTLTNTGDATLEIDGADAPWGFFPNAAFPIDVDPGQSAELDVSLDTSWSGDYSGPLTIDSTDPSSPFTLNLSGTVIQPPSIQVSDVFSTLTNGGEESFGAVAIGDAASQTFSVQNVGGGTLSISSIWLPSGFSLEAALPIDIDSGNTGSFIIDMDTSSAGSPGGVMAIDNNDDANDPFTLNLSGTVTSPPALQVNDGSTTLASGDSDSFNSAAVEGRMRR